jgi:hypothetical protein
MSPSRRTSTFICSAECGRGDLSYEGIGNSHTQRSRFTQTFGCFSSSVTGTARLYGREVDKYEVETGQPQGQYKRSGPGENATSLGLTSTSALVPVADIIPPARSVSVDRAVAQRWQPIGKLRRSFLSDCLKLRLLLVVQRGIEGLERGAHQMDRLQHVSEPHLHCVKAGG